MKQTENKTARIFIRISAEDKKYYSGLAKRRCITISELFLSAAANVVIKNYKKEQEQYSILANLAKEINYIGHNINQATVALHQLRITGKADSGQLQVFNKLQEDYHKLLSDYKNVIDKLMYHE